MGKSRNARYYGHSALDNGVVMATESYNSKGDLR
jgi:hypothetical protein